MFYFKSFSIIIKKYDISPLRECVKKCRLAMSKITSQVMSDVCQDCKMCGNKVFTSSYIKTGFYLTVVPYTDI